MHDRQWIESWVTDILRESLKEVVAKLQKVQPELMKSLAEGEKPGEDTTFSEAVLRVATGKTKIRKTLKAKMEAMIEQKMYERIEARVERNLDKRIQALVDDKLQSKSS